MVEDIQVIKLVLQGKVDHYAQLIDKYHNEIFSFVFNMVGQYQDTEDLVQEIFYKTYKALPKYDPDKASYRTWLYRVASNHTLNHLNSARRRNTTSTEVDFSQLAADTDVEAEAIKNEQIRQIVTVMKKVLSHKHQTILSLHYFSGLSVQEISESMEIPDKTIYKAIKSSIEKIRKEVAIHG